MKADDMVAAPVVTSPQPATVRDYKVTARVAKPSDATVRALKRVEAGEKPTCAAEAEHINPSTLFRALAKRAGRVMEFRDAMADLDTHVHDPELLKL